MNDCRRLNVVDSSGKTIFAASGVKACHMGPFHCDAILLHATFILFFCFCSFYYVSCLCASVYCGPCCLS